jgi:putative transposase
MNLGWRCEMDRSFRRCGSLRAKYPRYGYRRIQVFMARSGHVMSTDLAHRLWPLAGLQVPR